MVLDSRVEIGFIGRLNQDSRIQCIPVWDDELILAAPRGHRLEGRGEITVEDIIKEPFILREKGSGTRQIMEEHLRSMGSPPVSRFNIVCELGSSEAVKEAVLSGLGISILSINAVKRELKQGLAVRIPLSGTKILRRISIIMRKQFNPLPHHLEFIQAAKAFELNQ
jgi:DNA-binding transcriptional LysR family regulator